jgi:hypothetical protein
VSDLRAKRHRLDGAASAVYAEFDHRGWTDGLPVIPPTEESVRVMLSATPLAPDHVLVTLRPTLRHATVELVAINAVMAGCEPVHFPAVVAAVEALSDPNYYLLPMGTNPAAPLVVVNGPARHRLGVTSTYNTLGPGQRANMTIGRAVHLTIQNVGMGGRFGVRDQTTIGMPGKLGMCMAENEEASPWEPLHVERGFAPEAGTVTLFNVNGSINFHDDHSEDAGSLLQTIGRTMAIQGASNYFYPSMPLLVLGVQHATRLAAGGYSKADVKRALWAISRIPAAELSPGIRKFLEQRSKRRTKVVDGFAYVTDDADGIGIVVAGGLGAHSQFMPSLGFNNRDSASREMRWTSAS